jgi:hypothetical protein
MKPNRTGTGGIAEFPEQFIADGKAILMGTDAVARIGQKNAFVNEETAEWLLLGSSTDFEG